MDKILSLSSIRKRKAALEDEMAELDFRLAEISDSLEELSEAEAFVKRFGDEGEGSGDLVQEPEAKLPFPPAIRAKTTKAALLLALRVSNEPWMTANELQIRASSLKAADIPMATVSPMLSNLKNAGLILREGHRVALATRIKAEQEKSESGEVLDGQTRYGSAPR